MLRIKRSFWKFFKWFIFGWMGCLICQLLFLLLFFINVENYLIVKHQFEKADAAVVSGGVLEYRVRQAVELYKQGRVDQILFLDYAVDGHKPPSADAENALLLARHCGLPDSVGLVYSGSENTCQEAEAAKRFAEYYGWESVVSVTDHYHSRRAFQTYKKVVKGIRIYSSPCRDRYVTNGKWWENEANVVYVFTELVKLIYYLFRYGVWPV